MPRLPKSWSTVALIVASTALVATAVGSLAVGASPAKHLTAAPITTSAPSTTTTTTTMAPTTTVAPTTVPPTTVPKRVKKKAPRKARVRATFTIYPPLPGGSSPTTVNSTPPATTPAATTPTTVSPVTTLAGGLVAGHVTAVGDSVMLDYATPLAHDVPGIYVDAAVSRQWDVGEEILSQLKAEGRLGSTVVVALGTNGPIMSADFDRMMDILAGTTRVVFVNIVVDQPWQGPNNAVIAQGVASHPHTVLASWASLEATHRSWVYSDGTHLPIDGPGAVALAALIASKI
jgi:hypothetical protein